MTLLEGFRIVKHYNLVCLDYHEQAIFVTGMCFAVTSALFIAVYMATSMMDILRMRQDELEQALEETERLEAEKSQFLDIVVHDLKSPLAAIETMITSNLAVYGDKIPPKVKQVMERIPIRTSTLLKFIQELLDLSRIEKIDQVHMNFKPLNFLPIVTATVEMYMKQALEKNIQITLNSDPDIPPIVGNKDHLERMIANLISNAITYTQENGSVNIKITSENDEVILTVADTGIGISEDALPHIFSEFFRADNARKILSSGTGLGLSITKAIVEKHGGTISVKSAEGEGTVFTVKLTTVSS